jgi:RNA recognition motif-containing protein
MSYGDVRTYVYMYICMYGKTRSVDRVFYLQNWEKRSRKRLPEISEKSHQKTQKRREKEKMSSRDRPTRVYCGKLPRDVTEREVRRLFDEFGRLRDVRVLTGFAFVEYEDYRDARDAVDRLDGTRFLGDRY